MSSGWGVKAAQQQHRHVSINVCRGHVQPQRCSVPIHQQPVTIVYRQKTKRHVASAGFILCWSWMSVWNVMTIHPIDVEQFQSGAKRQTLLPSPLKTGFTLRPNFIKACKRFLFCYRTRAVPVLNLPVWNGLFSCSVLMLWSCFWIIPCH